MFFVGTLTISQGFYELYQSLQCLYDKREAEAIAHEVLQYICGFDRVQRILEKNKPLSVAQQTLYSQVTKSLLEGTPMQYVLQAAWFLGREYYVNNSVLIPRPETEELVDWVVSDLKILGTTDNEIRVLDIGTGSGCIAISIKNYLKNAIVDGIDISLDALTVARNNATKQDTTVNFRKIDVLDEGDIITLPVYNIVISNPPYIPLFKKNKMAKNVIGFEPHMALFVPDEDPLVFYRAICNFGKSHLLKGGQIYCEIESDFAADCESLFLNAGYSVDVKKDMHDNWRMLKAILTG